MLICIATMSLQPGSRLLEIERSKASFSVEELKVYLHGHEYLDRQNKILPILESEVGTHHLGMLLLVSRS